VIGSHELRNHFGYHLERAAAGRRLLITRRGRVYAELAPPPPAGAGPALRRVARAPPP